MNGHSEGSLFTADFGFEAESARDAHASTSAGTYPLRRARYFSENGTPLLNAEERRQLTNLVNEVDPETKHMMIVQNLRMVVSIAKRYTDRGLDLVELVRAGTQGLIQALERSEMERNFRFSTYVTRSICQNIERAIMNRNILSGSIQATSVPVVSFDNAIH